MELWNLQAIEKSEKILNEIKKITDFVLIGGWATYLYTKSIKSTDIDIYINFDDFFKFQAHLSNKGIFINYNKNLNKYEVKTEGIDIDIYTPHKCNLIVSCKEVFDKNLYEIIEGFKVIKIEYLILLKLKAEFNRKLTLKGFKDRCDILALIDKADEKILNKLIKNYNGLYLELIKVIKESKEEYNYAFQKEFNLRELKLKKQELLKELL